MNKLRINLEMKYLILRMIATLNAEFLDLRRYLVLAVLF